MTHKERKSIREIQRRRFKLSRYNANKLSRMTKELADYYSYSANEALERIIRALNPKK